MSVRWCRLNITSLLLCSIVRTCLSGTEFFLGINPVEQIRRLNSKTNFLCVIYLFGKEKEKVSICFEKRYKIRLHSLIHVYGFLYYVCLKVMLKQQYWQNYITYREENAAVILFGFYLKAYQIFEMNILQQFFFIS